MSSINNVLINERLERDLVTKLTAGGSEDNFIIHLISSALYSNGVLIPRLPTKEFNIINYEVVINNDLARNSSVRIFILDLNSMSGLHVS